MNRADSNSSRISTPNKTTRALAEGAGLVCAPQRIIPLVSRLIADELSTFEPRHLYSYTATTVHTANALRSVIDWILRARRPDGGIAAYYSLLTGYSDSYPEVTGYLIPTLYDFSELTGDPSARVAAERATEWLLSLQMPSGAFPAGLHGADGNSQPSVFNTGQILQGLVRAYLEAKKAETQNAGLNNTKLISGEILSRAVAAANWLATIQQSDGSWSGAAAYQGVAHTYYSMVAWALAQLAAESSDPRHDAAAGKNIDWVLSHFQPSGWIDGINLRGHPIYLHFIGYVIQGVLQCGILLRRDDAIDAAANSAWVLLRKFETHKGLSGAYEPNFADGQHFSCLTGNAQMSCVWLRLFEVTGDLRYLNAALKMNGMLRQSLPISGSPGIAGGVAGSRPIWGAYQPLRFISWGAKFLADALMLEQRLMRQVEAKLETESARRSGTTAETNSDSPVTAIPEASECA